MRFSELIKRKETLLTRLLPVSMKQHDLVRDEDFTQLNTLLIAKQQLMTDWEENEAQLKPFRDIPPEDRQWDSDAEHHETAAAIERSKALLEQIIKLDEESMTDVSTQKNELEEQIRRIQQGSRVHANYAKQSIGK